MRAEKTAPTTKKSERPSLRLNVSAGSRNSSPKTRTTKMLKGAELAVEVGLRALLHRCADGLHVLGAGVGGEYLTSEEEAEHQAR